MTTALEADDQIGAEGMCFAAKHDLAALEAGHPSPDSQTRADNQQLVAAFTAMPCGTLTVNGAVTQLPLVESAFNTMVAQVQASAS